MGLEEDSKKYTIINVNTHKGLYQNSRLPFGIASVKCISKRKKLMKIFFKGFLVLSIVSMTYWLQVKAIVSVYRTWMMFYRNKKLRFDLKKETCVNIADDVIYCIKRYGRQTTEDKVQPI